MRSALVGAFGLLLTGLIFIAHAQIPNVPMVGFGGGSIGPSAFSLAFKGSATDVTGTITAQPFGTAAADRDIVVTLAAGLLSGGAVTGVTIGGVTATRQVQATQAGSVGFHIYGEIWTAAVPTGATGTIVISFTGSSPHFELGIYAMYGAASQVPTSNASTNGFATSLSASLAIPAGGAGVGLFGSNGTSTSIAWTNLSEDFDAVPATFGNMGGASSAVTGTSSRQASGTANGNVVLALAAWGP